MVYVRQSSAHQVVHHRESQRRQRDFVCRATDLGWPRERIQTIDEDQGRSGSRSGRRSGFEEMVAMTALGKVGVVLALEVARLARGNRDWYQLLDVCSITNTLIGDEEGLYDPRAYNDRLLLGLKGTMSEAELHLMRQRLVEATRAKAKRGELRRRLPAGFVWDEAGRIQKNPDEQIAAMVKEVFERFARLGTIHQTHLSLREEGIEVPVRSGPGNSIVWTGSRYGHLREMLNNPIYAGAYVYGRRQTEEVLDDALKARKRKKTVDPEHWHALLREHHEGYIDWDQYERNRMQIKANYRAGNGAPREGESLLQGLVLCGRCGRSMRVAYGRCAGQVRYTCEQARRQTGEQICQAFGARRLERAVETLLLEALAPAGMAGMIRAAEDYEKDNEAERERWNQKIERARYEVRLAERQYNAVDPDNRLVARELERRYEKALRELEATEAESSGRLKELDRPLSEAEQQLLTGYAEDLGDLWNAPSTRPQDRKRIARCLIEAAVVHGPHGSETLRAELHWKGGEVTTIEVPRGKRGVHRYVLSTELVELVRTLAREFSDGQIARILRCKRLKTTKGRSFAAYHVANVRRKYGIASGPLVAVKGKDIYTAEEASERLGVCRSTVIRWVESGLLRGRQTTDGAPWRIVVAAADIQRLKPTEPDKTWMSLKRAASVLGLSQQTILQKLKSGEVEGTRVQTGRRASWRIRLPEGTYDNHPTLF
jgi:excisionase family DNA binding protein